MPRTSQVHKADHNQHLLMSQLGSHYRFHHDNAFPVHSYRTGKGIPIHTCKTSLAVLNNIVTIKTLQTLVYTSDMSYPLSMITNIKLKHLFSSTPLILPYSVLIYWKYLAFLTFCITIYTQCSKLDI